MDQLLPHALRTQIRQGAYLQLLRAAGFDLVQLPIKISLPETVWKTKRHFEHAPQGWVSQDPEPARVLGLCIACDVAQFALDVQGQAQGLILIPDGNLKFPTPEFLGDLGSKGR